MDNFTKFMGIIFLVIVIFILVGFIVMWLWNWLMPEIFDLTEINFWKSIGLILLSSIFFGSRSYKT